MIKKKVIDKMNFSILIPATVIAGKTKMLTIFDNSTIIRLVLLPLYFTLK